MVNLLKYSSFAALTSHSTSIITGAKIIVLLIAILHLLYSAFEASYTIRCIQYTAQNTTLLPPSQSTILCHIGILSASMSSCECGGCAVLETTNGTSVRRLWSTVESTSSCSSWRETRSEQQSTMCKSSTESVRLIAVSNRYDCSYQVFSFIIITIIVITGIFRVA